MQINLKIHANNVEMAIFFRKKFYGVEATAIDYRDAFIFGKVIDDFGSRLEELRPYLDDDYPKIQKKYAIRKDTYDKILTISKTLECSIASVYRAIIKYSYEKFNTVEDIVEDIAVKTIQSKIILLEKQLNDAQKTLNEIRNLL